MKWMSEKLKQELAELLILKEQRIKYNKLETLFPDEGPYRRELYPKHIEFMNQGATHRQRAIIAANRTGKTLMGAYEMACHLTGLYPKWWKGRVFDEPVNAWCASIRNSDTKDIIQKELYGDVIDPGTGMIPRHLIIGRPTRKAGVADAIETIRVRHVSGGMSVLGFKSYEQGRDGFQGTKKQVIWLDEEPKDYSIFTECLTRTMDDKNPGIIYCTFTPLFGLSDTVLSFMPDGKLPINGIDPKNPHKFITQVSWEEVPHLNDEQKREILASYSPHEREARSKGIPNLGSGAIYPYLEDQVVVRPFKIPEWWPRVYGLDVGWNRTAAVWGALDRESGTIYLYSEHYVGQAAPAIHASSIKSRGAWIPGVVDPASMGASQVDGTKLIDLYEQEGLRLEKADNAVEAGIYRVGQLFESGQLKIFDTCTNLIAEFRVYRRDESGRIVKKNDHLMDAMRYLCLSGLDKMETLPDPDQDEYFKDNTSNRNSLTGY
jgi:phage terminase large subunit-like protein